MFATLSLIRREISAYFLSPIAYVVLAVFLAVTGALFYLTLQQLTARGPQGLDYPLQLMLSDNWFWLVFLFIPPLLTMRLFAEERGSGTLEMLLTAPLRDWQIVLSKYLACFAFYLLLWVPTLAYLPVLLDLEISKDIQIGWLWLVLGDAFVFLFVLGVYAFWLFTSTGQRAKIGALRPMIVKSVIVSSILIVLFAAIFFLAGQLFFAGLLAPGFRLEILAAGVDPWPVVSSYLGIALAGAMFLAIGLFVSSLVRSQMVAALVSLFLSLIFIVAGFWRPEMDTGSLEYRVRFFFTVPLHFAQNFTRGLVDSRQLVLYASVTLFCLFLTVRSLEGRRWR